MVQRVTVTFGRSVTINSSTGGYGRVVGSVTVSATDNDVGDGWRFDDGGRSAGIHGQVGGVAVWRCDGSDESVAISHTASEGLNGSYQGIVCYGDGGG